MEATAIKPINCPNHRMTLVSHEQIWDNKWEYGEPVKSIATFKCVGQCKHKVQYEFKEAKR